MNLVNIEQKVFQLESELRLLKQHVAELRKDFDNPAMDVYDKIYLPVVMENSIQAK